MTFKHISLAAALTLGSFSAHAQLLPPVGDTLPNLLTTVGTVADPLLQPILGGITGPLVSQLVPQLVPVASSLLGGTVGGPINLIENLPLGEIVPGLLGNLPLLPGLD